MVSHWVPHGSADPISRLAWRNTLRCIIVFGSFWVAKITPFLDPNFSPPRGQLAAPSLYPHEESGPNLKSCTWLGVLGPASYPGCPWLYHGSPSHSWERVLFWQFCHHDPTWRPRGVMRPGTLREPAWVKALGSWYSEGIRSVASSLPLIGPDEGSVSEFFELVSIGLKQPSFSHRLLGDNGGAISPTQRGVET